MDPNMALINIRGIISDIRVLNTHEYPDHTELAALALDLAEVVADLDKWISLGGFRPEDWSV